MSRLNKIINLIDEKNIDALLIKSKNNKRYVGALTGSGVYLLITKNGSYQILDGRYVEEAKKKTKGFINKVAFQGTYIQSIIKILNDLSIKRLGIENQSMTIKEYMILSEANIDITLITDELGKIRSIKSNEEIDLISKACQITDDVFNKVISEIKEGITELDISALLQYWSLKNGASSMAFDTIVTSGERGVMPHGRPTNRKVKRNEAITIDFGVVYEGYQSDMTRTVFIGEPSEKIREIYELVLKAQMSAISEIREGVRAKDIDRVARDIIANAGFGEYFNHGLGHGIGLGDGEFPILNSRSEDILKEGMVMSCEPGIYIPNLGGVRIEDDVVIKNGKGISINKTTKEFIIIGE